MNHPIPKEYIVDERLKDLADAGVSIWLDDLSRSRITSGNLAELIAERSVTGVTTNPTIFATALSRGEAYAEQLKGLSEVGIDEAIRELTTSDVRAACDILRPTHDATEGRDGRVSIEVEPGLANDTQGTIAQAALLHQMVDRENVLIKIPATKPGLEAITALIADLLSADEQEQVRLAQIAAGAPDGSLKGVLKATLKKVASKVAADSGEALMDKAAGYLAPIVDASIAALGEKAAELFAQ